METLSQEEIDRRMVDWYNWSKENPLLREEVRKLKAENKQLRADLARERKEREESVEALKLQIEELREMVFGRQRGKDDDGQDIPKGRSSDDEKPKGKKPRSAASYRRPTPKDEDVTEEKRLGIDACPDCGEALTNKGFLRFMTYGEKFDASMCIDFLKRIITNTDAMPLVIWDRHPVHRSKNVQSWLKEHEREIRCAFLPAYYPQGNPVELLNQDVKANAVGRKRPKTLQELKKNVRSHLRKKQRRPSEARTYFKAASVRYAGEEGVQ